VGAVVIATAACFVDRVRTEHDPIPRMKYFVELAGRSLHPKVVDLEVVAVAEMAPIRRSGSDR